MTPVLHRLTPEAATGPVVVLVHGMEDDWRSWLPLARLLDQDWQVYALQPPWVAGADHRWRRRRSPGEWLRAGLDQLDGPADVLVGHSLGANAVLEALTGPPLGLGGAVLIAPFYCPPGAVVTWSVFERAKRDFEAIIRAALELRMGPRLTRLNQADPDLAATMEAKMIDRIGPLGFLAIFDLFLSTADLDLAEVSVPTLVVAGDCDPALDGERVVALRQRLPAGQVVVERGFDHFCHVLQVEAVAAHLAAFVELTCTSKGSARHP